MQKSTHLTQKNKKVLIKFLDQELEHINTCMLHNLNNNSTNYLMKYSQSLFVTPDIHDSTAIVLN